MTLFSQVRPHLDPDQSLIAVRHTIHLAGFFFSAALLCLLSPGEVYHVKTHKKRFYHEVVWNMALPLCFLRERTNLFFLMCRIILNVRQALNSLKVYLT